MGHIQKLTDSKEMRIQKCHTLSYGSQENENGYIMHVNTTHRSDAENTPRALQTLRTPN